MPAPSNSNSLTLGRPIIDTVLISDPGSRILWEQMHGTWMGQGCPSPAKDGDTTYQALYARYIADEWFIYAGKPTDPMNPDLVTSPFSGSTSIAVLDEGVALGSFDEIDFVGAGVVATDAGGGRVTVTIAGGGGATYTAGDGIDIDGSNVISAELSTNGGLEFDGSGIAVSIGDGLEMSANDIVVKPHTYIDVTASGVAVDFTEVAHYSGSDYQFLINDTGTFEWNTGVGGSGITFSNGGNEFEIIADVHNDSHVGLVDPTTGEDSVANDAQIGILWHEIEGFDDGRNQLHGHVADDPTKPKVTCKTTEDWLELLESYDSSKSMVVYNDSTNAGTEGDERVRWVESPQKVIWGLDPDGGHTITTSGTTLTLTLKVTKYTFDAVNFVSAVDADVTVTYEGTECATP